MMIIIDIINIVIMMTILRYSTWEPEENILDPRLIQQFTQKEADRIAGMYQINTDIFIRLNLYHLVTYHQRAVGTPVQSAAESQRWKRRRNNPSDQKAGKNNLDYWNMKKNMCK